jgi:hypothetical protein
MSVTAHTLNNEPNSLLSFPDCVTADTLVESPLVKLVKNIFWLLAQPFKLAVSCLARVWRRITIPNYQHYLASSKGHLRPSNNPVEWKASWDLLKEWSAQKHGEDSPIHLEFSNWVADSDREEIVREMDTGTCLGNIVALAVKMLNNQESRALVELEEEIDPKVVFAVMLLQKATREIYLRRCDFYGASIEERISDFRASMDREVEAEKDSRENKQRMLLVELQRDTFEFSERVSKAQGLHKSKAQGLGKEDLKELLRDSDAFNSKFLLDKNSINECAEKSINNHKKLFQNKKESLLLELENLAGEKVRIGANGVQVVEIYNLMNQMVQPELATEFHYNTVPGRELNAFIIEELPEVLVPDYQGILLLGIPSELIDEGSRHAVLLQVDNKEKKYRVYDNNFAIYQFDSIEQMLEKEQERCHSEYTDQNNYSLCAIKHSVSA